jgi:outer membrane protein assembly factor BamE (lipoprotein component of BamABCDE complex)
MNSIIRRITLGLAASAVAVTPLAVTGSAHADPGSPGCATRHEYQEVKKGMTMNRVARIFGTPGHISYSYHGSYMWETYNEYRPCQPFTEWSMVEVDFGKKHGHVVVTGKSSYWIS